MADDDGARALALASSAIARATHAERKAADAAEGHRSTYEALGGLTTEVASIRGGVKELSGRFSALEQLVKSALQKLGSGVVQAQRAALKSGHDLEQWKEDSTVTHLREELLAQTRKYDSLRARDKAIRGWIWKVLAIVLGGLALAWLTIELGLKK